MEIFLSIQAQVQILANPILLLCMINLNQKERRVLPKPVLTLVEQGLGAAGLWMQLCSLPSGECEHFDEAWLI